MIACDIYWGFSWKKTVKSAGRGREFADGTRWGNSQQSEGS